MTSIAERTRRASLARSPLPNIGAFRRIATSVLSAFRERLRDTGVTEAGVAAFWKGPGRFPTAAAQAPVRQWRARGRDDPGAILYRAFCLGDPVPDELLDGALGKMLAQALLDGGLLSREGGWAVSPFRLQFYRELPVLADDLRIGKAAVFAVGPGSAAFHAFQPPDGGRTADIGCGAGALALWLAQYSDCVIATDINPRALEFLRLNTRLNGISNIEIREGDLFAPVAGEMFDLILSQLPFVPCPDPHVRALFREAGPDGDELAQRFLAGAPEHLVTGGRAVAVFEAPVDAASGIPRIPSVTQGGRLLTFIGAEVGADAYSLRYGTAHAPDYPGESAVRTEVMSGHLAKRGMRGMCPAISVLEACPGVGWRETVRADHDLWGRLDPAAVAAVFSGIERLIAGDAAIVGTKLWLPNGTLLIAPAEGGGAEVVLGLPEGFPARFITLPRSAWDRLAGLVRSACGVRQEDLTDSNGRQAIEVALRAGLLDMARG